MPKGGSLPGERRGGREKGTPNRVQKKAVFRAQVEASGLSPLEYMLKVMRDPEADEFRRDRMSAWAAPYVHPRLASIDFNDTASRRSLEEIESRITAVLRAVFTGGTGKPSGAAGEDSLLIEGEVVTQDAGAP